MTDWVIADLGLDEGYYGEINGGMSFGFDGLGALPKATPRKAVAPVSKILAKKTPAKAPTRYTKMPVGSKVVPTVKTVSTGPETPFPAIFSAVAGGATMLALGIGLIVLGSYLGKK